VKTGTCLAALALLSLGACQKVQDDQKPAPAASATSEAPVSVEQGRLVLPAVAGNPGAAYFVLDNRASGTAIVESVSVDGADKADLHQTAGDSMVPVDRVEIAPGTSLKLEPGALHLMVFGIGKDIVAGGTARLTVNLADGTSASGELKVEAAGGDMDMDHGAMN